MKKVLSTHVSRLRSAEGKIRMEKIGELIFRDWKDQNDNVDAADDNYYDDCSFSGYEYEDEGDIL